MLAKRKMQIMPRKAEGADEVSRIYKKAMERARAHASADAKALGREGRGGEMTLTYYPGCSLRHSSG